MKLLFPAILALIPSMVLAVPNSVIGPLVVVDSPLNGLDLTAALTSSDLWFGKAVLPGNWQEECRIADADISHLLARPKFLGEEVVLMRATRREDKLVALDVTFADAGSFFGYFDEKLPADLSRREVREEIAQRTSKRRAEFAASYAETLSSLNARLMQVSAKSRPRSVKVGHTRTLRSEMQDFPAGDLTYRLLAADERLIRVTVTRTEDLPKSWLDPSIEALNPRERLPRLQQSIRKDADGTVRIDGLQPIPQGYRPYCGLNSLAMSARHFGLHIDEDWLAAAGGFKNTGSVDGSRILSLYPAVAAEAGFSMQRSSRFDENNVRRAIDSGFPVIVWRRFSMERDHLHTRFFRDYANDPAATLPDPSQPTERSTWPGADAPLHASVLTGYHPGRREFLFLESWTGKDSPRRMRAEELTATTYLTFVFQP